MALPLHGGGHTGRQLLSSGWLCKRVLKSLEVPHLHGVPKQPVHLCILLCSPRGAELKGTGSACKPPTPPVRALIMDAVKGEESEPVPYLPCDPPPRPFPAGTALSLYQAGGCGHSFIHSANAHQMLFCTSHGSSLWGTQWETRPHVSQTHGAYILQKK